MATAGGEGLRAGGRPRHHRRRHRPERPRAGTWPPAAPRPEPTAEERGRGSRRQEAWRTKTFKRAFISTMHASGSCGMWGPAGGDANHAEISSSLQQQEALFSHFF